MRLGSFLRELLGRTSRDPPPQESGSSATLGSLPLDVLVLICQHLNLKERIALASCCRALWVRPDVRGDTSIWGHLSVGDWESSSERRLRSLSAWLAGRGVWRLRLHYHTPCYNLDGLWIERLGEPRCDRGVRPLLRLLHSVPNLHGLEMRGLGLETTPTQLTVLTQLCDLSLRGNRQLGKHGDAAFQPLQQLTTLTRINLRSCGLKCLPSPLGCLRLLKDLDVSVNDLGKGGPAATQPLQHLTALTCLEISECGLAALPNELSVLGHLAELIFSFDPPLKHAAAPELQPLQHLAMLTHLQLSCSGAEPSLVRSLVGPRVHLECW